MWGNRKIMTLYYCVTPDVYIVIIALLSMTVLNNAAAGMSSNFKDNF